MAYVKDYGHGIGKRSLAEKIKKHCLSKGMADYLEFADSPEEILETLGGLFARPSKLINSLMDPLKKHKKVPFDDWPGLLAYLTKIRSMLKEVDGLGIFTLFNTVSNITDKLPSNMVRKWMDYSNDLLDSQLGATFERFIAQEWKYATSVVSRTTSVESALKAVGVTGGGSGSSGGHQQEDARGSKSGNRDGKRSSNGDQGPHQVPVGPTQQGGQSQAAPKTAFSAARSDDSREG
jgi:hypothetical protein